jgi:hypothetical protein
MEAVRVGAEMDWDLMPVVLVCVMIFLREHPNAQRAFWNPLIHFTCTNAHVHN